MKIFLGVLGVLGVLGLLVVMTGCSETKEYKEFTKKYNKTNNERIYCDGGFTLKAKFKSSMAKAPAVYLVDSDKCLNQKDGDYK